MPNGNPPRLARLRPPAWMVFARSAASTRSASWDPVAYARRYSEIKTGLLRGAVGTKEIAPRVLSRELKALAENGLIVRKDYGVCRPRSNTA